MRTQSAWTFAAALRFWSLSCLAEGHCGRCLHTVIGLCGPHPRPLLLAMLCSLCGLVILCFLRGLSDWNPAHLEGAHFFAWVRSPSFADTTSLSRMFALPKKAGAIQPLSEVCHYRGDHLVGRQLLMRFRCSVSIAPVLSGIMLGGSWGFGASIRRIDFSSLGAHRVIRSLKTSLLMHFGCSPDLTMLLAMLDLRHPRQTRVPLDSSTHAPRVQCRSLLCMRRAVVLSMILRIGYSCVPSAAGGGCRC